MRTTPSSKDAATGRSHDEDGKRQRPIPPPGPSPSASHFGKPVQAAGADHPARPGSVDASGAGGEPTAIALLEALLNEAPFGIAYVDRDMRYVRVNERMARMNGSPAAEHVGRTPAEVIPDMPPEGQMMLQHVLRTGEAIRGVEMEVPPAPGQSVPRSFVGDTVAVRDAHHEIVGLAIIAIEVTETRRLERERERLLDELFALAHTDPLTGLPNRRAWNQALEEAVSAQRTSGPSPWVALLDIDHFKRLNDLNGHAYGDRVLRATAARWQTLLREGDLQARYGGEEFSLLLGSCEAATATTVVERIRHASEEVTCSAGITQVDPGDTADMVMQRADRALYAAKAGGRDRATVNLATDARTLPPAA